MDDFNIEGEIIKLMREIEGIEKSLIEAKAQINTYDSPMFRQQFIYKVQSLEISLVLKRRLLKILID